MNSQNKPSRRSEYAAYILGSLGGIGGFGYMFIKSFTSLNGMHFTPNIPAAIGLCICALIVIGIAADDYYIQKKDDT